MLLVSYCFQYVIASGSEVRAKPDPAPPGNLFVLANASKHLALSVILSGSRRTFVALV
jgi:hypothetical protein